MGNATIKYQQGNWTSSLAPMHKQLSGERAIVEEKSFPRSCCAGETIEVKKEAG